MWTLRCVNLKFCGYIAVRRKGNTNHTARGVNSFSFTVQLIPEAFDVI